MKTKYRNPNNIIKDIDKMRVELVARQNEIIRLEKEIGKSKNDEDLPKLVLMYKKQHVVLADLIINLSELIQLGYKDNDNFFKIKN